MKTALASAISVCIALPAFPHRLDEYLQGTLISIEKNRLRADMSLTPGVAVYPYLISLIDTDGDGIISDAEQLAYAGRVLGDLSLSIDGRPLTPRLLSIRFPPIAEMQEGRGEIELDFDANLPAGGHNRKLTLENHHRSGISAYQVNCLVPHDPDIRIQAQSRNFTQSLYELDYVETSVPTAPAFFASLSGPPLWLVAFALLLFLRVLWWRRKRRNAELRVA